MLRRSQTTDGSSINGVLTTDGHPNVVRYYSKLEDDDWVYIVMALCDETLESRVANGGLAPRAARAAACAELCAGLGYLHSLEITHRDLKPTNILFKGATLKICDMVRSTT